MTLQPIKYNDGKLSIIDQLLLPQKLVYMEINSVEEGWHAIKDMNTRGAPAIAVVGALSLAVELHQKSLQSKQELQEFVSKSMDYLVTARPTAVNIGRAAIDIKRECQRLIGDDITTCQLKERVIKFIEGMLAKDESDNIALGDHGAKHIIENVKEDIVVLTHCNAGALATVAYGTAVGVIRSLNNFGKLKHAFCTETRAYNQGARLTAYELVHEKIPSTLIIDSAVSIALSRKQITAIVTGADRVAMNGDTANKIGTYQIAISAKHHGVPFYIAAPTTTIDVNMKNGDQIVIEERKHEEITHFQGERVAADIECWNPAFDVTPADLITGGIITEYGVFKSTELKEKFKELNLI